MKGRELNNWIFFIVAPILSLPITLNGIYKRSSTSLFIFILFLGIMSYLYIPHFTNDKTRYYEFYLDFVNYSWVDFFNNIFKTRPDFLLHLIIYIFCNIGISVQFIFLFVTTITAGLIFYVFFKIANIYIKDNKLFFLSFLLIFLSLALKDFFSGIRFYFAISFLFFGFYKTFIENKKIGFLYVIIASFIHFSTLLFILLYGLNFFFKKHYKLFRWLYILSVFFLFIPKELLFDTLLNIFNMGSGFETKVQIYLAEEDFIEGGIMEGSSYNYYIYIISISWSIFAHIYLLTSLKKTSVFRSLVYSGFFLINIFYQATTVYSRYLLFLSLLFSILMIVEVKEKRNMKNFYILLLLYFFNFFNSLIILRYNLMESYLNSDIVFLFTALMKSIGYNDILNY